MSEDVGEQGEAQMATMATRGDLGGTGEQGCPRRLEILSASFPISIFQDLIILHRGCCFLYARSSA